MIPIMVAIVMVGALYLSDVTVTNLLSGATSSIGAAVTGFSILAGFNATSLSIFATSGSPVAKRLKEELLQEQRRPKLDQILSYFAWSVVVQLVLLLASILLSFLFAFNTATPQGAVLSLAVKRLLGAKMASFGLWAMVFLGIVGTLYSITLTIRNIIILYTFLIADAHQPTKDPLTDTLQQLADTLEKIGISLEEQKIERRQDEDG